uniref:Uncharacterized protein n=1 Tax=Ditylenchus dipsaci TaxID=166011 RepID=A0A915DX55_9BILA
MLNPPAQPTTTATPLEVSSLLDDKVTLVEGALLHSSGWWNGIPGLLHAPIPSPEKAGHFECWKGHENGDKEWK